MAPDKANLAVPGPDAVKVDVHHLMPSYSGLGDIGFDWQIKARSGLRKTRSGILHCDVWVVPIDKKYGVDLRAAVRHNRRFYLALAIPAVETLDLSVLPPAQRFNWFAINLTAYCALFDPRESIRSIHVPVDNKLNLALFSLIWSAHWVELFTDPLRHSPIGLAPSIQTLVQSFSTDLTAMGDEVNTLLSAAESEFSTIRDGMSPLKYREFSQPLALTGSLRAIAASLTRSRGVGQIMNYCPEALGGTVNLWLFAKVYHEFMFVAAHFGKRNIRLFPVENIRFEATPKLMQAAIYNARAFYQQFGVEVRLVQMLKEGGGSDYSHYEGALVAFPWVSVDPTTGEMSLDHSRLSSKAEDLDVIKDALTRELAGTRRPTGGIFGDCVLSELLLNAEPVCLLPEESDHLEYPRALWHSNRVAV